MVVAWEADKKGIEEMANSRSLASLSLCGAWRGAIRSDPPVFGSWRVCFVRYLYPRAGTWRLANEFSHICEKIKS